MEVHYGDTIKAHGSGAIHKLDSVGAMGSKRGKHRLAVGGTHSHGGDGVTGSIGDGHKIDARRQEGSSSVGILLGVVHPRHPCPKSAVGWGLGVLCASEKMRPHSRVSGPEHHRGTWWDRL